MGGPGPLPVAPPLLLSLRGSSPPAALPSLSPAGASRSAPQAAAAAPRTCHAGLSLPQAQVLAELFGGRCALLDPPRPATIKTLIAFQAHWDRHPHLWDQICQARQGWCWWWWRGGVGGRLATGGVECFVCCSAGCLRHLPSPTYRCRRNPSPSPGQVWNTAFQVVAARQRSGAAADGFSFRAFMDGPVARVRRKPARARCQGRGPLAGTCGRRARRRAPCLAQACRPSLVPPPLPPPRVLVRSLDVGVNADGVITMLHDYTQVGALRLERGRGGGGVRQEGLTAG